MHERRNLTRWQLVHKARLKQEGAQVWVDCYIIDINFKGMQVALPIGLQRDVFIRMQIALSEDCTVELEAWAAWRKAVYNLNLHGLYFTKIKDEDKEKIYQFTRTHVPQQANQKWWQRLNFGVESISGPNKEPDKRIFRRFEAVFPVRILDEIDSREGRGRTADISAKGVGIMIGVQLKVRTPLELWIEPPDEMDPLYTRGEVAWSMPTGVNEYRTGVNLEKADLLGLSRLLRQAKKPNIT